MERDILFKEIKDFIIRERWEYNFEIKKSSSIQEDLKIYGDDASEFLTKFCKEFSVEPKNFNFDDYFAPEPGWTDFFRKKKKYKSFTVFDLIKAAEKAIYHKKTAPIPKSVFKIYFNILIKTVNHRALLRLNRSPVQRRLPVALEAYFVKQIDLHFQYAIHLRN